MDVFALYADPGKHDDLKAILDLGAQQHPAGLAQNFLEKDIWVTELLRLLFDEALLGEMSVAFKGGTALSKCWRAIERFSEDIDLSLHWSDLAESDAEAADWERDEATAWGKLEASKSQVGKFRKRQEVRLISWSTALVDSLNQRFERYNIEGLKAELEEDSNGERINIHFPRLTAQRHDYQLDHILLEFGGRNRGRPTVAHGVTCYLSEVPELESLVLPTASVAAYDPGYILWEKLTALHQFSTQTKEPSAHRLARHWYDVDCLLQQEAFQDPLAADTAMRDVIAMKAQRWPAPGVDYEAVLSGGLKLIPAAGRLVEVKKDHQTAIDGGMFFSRPDDFDDIIARLEAVQDALNNALSGATL